MSAHHPSNDLLNKFAEASLDGALSGVISAHVEHCSQCRRSVKSVEATLSERVFEASITISATEMSEAWQRVSRRLGADSGPKPVSEAQNEIEIQGAKFVLPRSLKPWASKPIKWMPFGKGGKICKLGEEKGKSLFLIYLSSNEEVPLHSHAGMEHSYVISGSYAAEGTVFETGDFSSSSESVTHAPRAGSEDGCLLLSSVENRLNFLHGWLKPFNGLLWWVLNLRVRRIQGS
jgi:putative transcriptional regulator